MAARFKVSNGNCGCCCMDLVLVRRAAYNDGLSGQVVSGREWLNTTDFRQYMAGVGSGILVSNVDRKNKLLFTTRSVSSFFTIFKGDISKKDYVTLAYPNVSIYTAGTNEVFDSIGLDITSKMVIISKFTNVVGTRPRSLMLLPYGGGAPTTIATIDVNRSSAFSGGQLGNIAYDKVQNKIYYIVIQNVTTTGNDVLIEIRRCNDDGSNEEILYTTFQFHNVDHTSSPLFLYNLQVDVVRRRLWWTEFFPVDLYNTIMTLNLTTGAGSVALNPGNGIRIHAVDLSYKDSCLYYTKHTTGTAPAADLIMGLYKTDFGFASSKMVLNLSKAVSISNTGTRTNAPLRIQSEIALGCGFEVFGSAYKG